ncbi:MAG TPA: DUF2785 domain-containing protein [Vicinamibacterales bacterium]|jgi:hypothetical protein
MTILILAAVVFAANPAAAQEPVRNRADWIALAKGGFVVPDGRTAFEELVEMNPLLASDDPALRDDVAYGAAERWIVREHRLSPPELRRLLQLWSGNLNEGLGEVGRSHVFKRSFSALCLSLIAAADLSSPFLDEQEVRKFFDRMLIYFQRERDLRGFDPVRGWIHTVAHASDALKFLMRNPKLAPGSDVRLLDAMRGKIEASDTVFTWGDNDRMALALQSAVRREDANPAALAGWTQYWVTAYRTLWANGPQINPRRFATVENASQVMRSLYAALAMERETTPAGEVARHTVIAALEKMR